MDGIKVESCRGCGSKELESITSLGRFPYANAFPANNDSNQEKHRLALIVCRECTLCQLDEYPDLSKLYSNYIWLTNSSTFIHEYLDGLTHRLISLSTGRFEKIIEIASNDSTFLKKLSSHADKLIGIEPALNLVEHYDNPKIELISELFSSSCVESNREMLSKASLIIARNVLAHVPNIFSFLKACKSCMSSDSFLYLEFHDGDEIIQQLQFDSIYHEHQSYITEKALRLILRKLGFTIHSSWLGPIGGSSRSIIATITDLKKEPSVSEELDKIDLQVSLNEFRRWEKFRNDLDDYRINLENILRDSHSKNLNIVAFGASARSTTLAGFCSLSQWLNAIVDSSPSKHGRFWTGSDLTITSPSEIEWRNVDLVVLLAWNFQHEIVLQLKNRGFAGSVLRVLPKKPKLIEVKDAC